MLIIDVSKTKSTSQKLELDGDGVDYVIQFDWSTRYQRFFMQILDADKNLLISGLKLVPGSPLNLTNIDTNGPKGLFMVVGTGDLTRESFQNGGYKLYYFQRSGPNRLPLVNEFLTQADFQEYVEENAPEPPNFFDGLFVTEAQTGQPISPIITNSTGTEVSWLWGDGNLSQNNSAPTKNYIDDGTSHEVDTYSVLPADFDTIDVSDCYVTGINLTASNNITSLYVQNNKLGELNIGTLVSLTDIDLSNNLVTSFQLEGNPYLQTCYAQNNEIEDISINSVPSLRILNVAGNRIASVDPSNGTALEELYLSNNNIGTLDPTSNTSLTTLEASGCGLSALDISSLNLERFIASFNNISSIATNNLTSCDYFDISENNLPSDNVDSVVISLDNNNIVGGYLSIENNSNPTEASYPSYQSLISKSWVINIDDYIFGYSALFATYSQGSISFSVTTLDLSNASWDFGDGTVLIQNNNPAYTYSDGEPYHEVSISIAPDQLGSISAPSNEIYSIDLDPYVNATSIDLSDNQLTTIDINYNTLVETLDL
ncbi:MAG: hypothetical protein HRU21_09290, partial [Pseudomonadales bacterium]|nr:hypothetical protein [Pseudomonadales bacterium]